MGCRKMKCKRWISMESWRKVEERRKLNKIDGVRLGRLMNKVRNE